MLMLASGSFCASLKAPVMFPDPNVTVVSSVPVIATALSVGAVFSGALTLTVIVLGVGSRSTPPLLVPPSS